MNWSDKWCGDNSPVTVTIERDTGFEPATSSLGSWRQTHAAQGNRLRREIAMAEAGRLRTGIGHQVVRKVVRLSHGPRLAICGGRS